MIKVVSRHPSFTLIKQWERPLADYRSELKKKSTIGCRIFSDGCAHSTNARTADFLFLLPNFDNPFLCRGLIKDNGDQRQHPALLAILPQLTFREDGKWWTCTGRQHS